MSSEVGHEGSRVLMANAFGYVLDTELKRAERSQSFVSLVVLEVEGRRSTVLVETVSRLIDAIGQDVRSTDLIGRTDTGLALALLDADAAGLAHVIDRLAALIERHRQTFPIRVTVSAACYPGHGLDASSLWEHAASNVLMRVGRRRAARRDQASR